MAVGGASTGHTFDSPASAGLHAVPLFHAAWLFAAGIVDCHWLWLRPGLVLIALAAAAVLCAVAALRAPRIAWLPLAAMWLLLGAWCAEMEPQPAPAPDLGRAFRRSAAHSGRDVVDAGPVRTELEQNVDEAQGLRLSQRVDLRVAKSKWSTDES